MDETTPRASDAVALAEQIANLTGRSVTGLLRWAIDAAHSVRPDAVIVVLRTAERRFTNGQELPAGFPELAATSSTPILIFSDTEDGDWM